MNELAKIANMGAVSTQVDASTVDWIVANMPDNTVRAYRNAITKVDNWSDGRPVNDAQLAAFISEREQAGDSLSSIKIAVAAVNKRAELLGQEKVSGVHTKLALEVASKATRGKGRGQVDGLQWQEVSALCAKAEAAGGLAGLRDSAILQLMSDCLLRVSEVSAVDVDDIGRVLTIRHSKTDQTAQGAVVSIGQPTLDTINEYKVKAGITRGALFRRIRRGGIVTSERLTPDSIRRIVKKWVGVSRIKDGRYSGHSLRVGSAVSLAQAGAGIPDMQQVGRWKSPNMPGHYARNVAAENDATARFKYGKGR